MKNRQMICLKVLAIGYIVPLPLWPLSSIVFMRGSTSLALPPAGFWSVLFFSVPVIFAVNEAHPLRGLFCFRRPDLAGLPPLLDWSWLFIKGGAQLLLLPFAVWACLLLSLFWAIAAYLALRPAIAPVTKLVVLGFLGRSRMAALRDFHGLSWNDRAYFCGKFTYRPNGGLYRSAWP